MTIDWDYLDAALRRRNIATAAASNRQPTPTERQDTTGAAQ